MTIRIVRLGSPREDAEGLRLGTVRRPPRGVKKEDYSRKDIYDVWFPNLSPSEALVKEAQAVDNEKSWKTFKRKFRTLDLDLFIYHLQKPAYLLIIKELFYN